MRNRPANPSPAPLQSDASAAHWAQHSTRWNKVGGPLRPSAEDVRLMRAALGPAAAGHGLLLGATPALTALSNTTLTVDNCATRVPARATSWNGVHDARLGDWLALPDLGRRFDFAAGDGSLICVPYAQYGQLLDQVAAVLQPGAPLVLRVFTRPPQPESLEEVRRAVDGRQIGSFHAFKWRLAMALVAERSETGGCDLPVRLIHRAFTDLYPDRTALAALTGWPEAEIATIDSYAGSGASYSYPTLDDLRQAAKLAGWAVAAVSHGTYELAERCPIVTLRKPAPAAARADAEAYRVGRVAGDLWPAAYQPAVAQIDDLRERLRHIERQPAAIIEDGQAAQLAALVAHAADHSPDFAARLQAAGLDAAPATANLSHLPILTRRRIQEAGERLFCTRIPDGHGAVRTTQTSGSTGEPVVVRRSDWSHYYFSALTMRDHDWHGRDTQTVLAISRATTPVDGAFPDWGQPVNLFQPSGPLFTTRLDQDIAQQGAWLHRANPHYITTYPTNLAALLDWLAGTGTSLPRLRGIRTLGETIGEELRARVALQLGVPVVDSYSSQELGLIALQCPEADLYHTMDENLIVEVLRDDGTACEAGEVGRLVITDLHNFATPLIRYEIGDYAERGPACACGRGLGTLRRIVGRSRNMLRLANGDRRWPLVGFSRYRAIAPSIEQYQIVQTAIGWVTVTLVTQQPLQTDQIHRLEQLIADSLGGDLHITISCQTERLNISANGKFEEFVSLVE